MTATTAPVVVLAAKSKPPPQPPPSTKDQEATEAATDDSFTLCSSPKPLLATNASCDIDGKDDEDEAPGPVTVIPLPSLVTDPSPDLEDLVDSASAMENFEDEIAPKVIRPRLPDNFEDVANQMSTMSTPSPSVAAALRAPHPTPSPTLPLAPTPTPPPPPNIILPAVAAPVIAASAAAPVATTTMASGGAAPGHIFTTGWVCNVCSKECPSENELTLHKKRHKLDSPLICEYCNQQYTNR